MVQELIFVSADQVLLASDQMSILGGMVGSTHRLLEECNQLAGTLKSPRISQRNLMSYGKRQTSKAQAIPCGRGTESNRLRALRVERHA